MHGNLWNHDADYYAIDQGSVFHGTEEVSLLSYHLFGVYFGVFSSYW